MFESAEAARLAAARNGDQHAFGSLIEPYRRELQVHCYRLLGSLQDAEDLVQETLLRAWRRIDNFEGRASFRAWLYKIATNACFDALDKRRRRSLPHTAGQAAGPGEPMAAPLDEQLWLEPFPDALLDESATSPEARYDAHESISLAFPVALQLLPPRQRAVLILRDVLGWHADEDACGRPKPTPAPPLRCITLMTRGNVSRPRDSGADNRPRTTGRDYYLHQSAAFRPLRLASRVGRMSEGAFLATVLPACGQERAEDS